MSNFIVNTDEENEMTLDKLDKVMKRISSVGINTDYNEYPKIEDIIDPNWQYHNTEQLLDNYRTFQWRLEQMILEADNEEEENALISKELLNSLSYLKSPEYIAIQGEAKSTLENRHKNLSTIMCQIAMALTSIKKYDDNGEMYYELLMELYVRGKKPTAISLAAKLNISRSTFYEYKKNALKLMSTCLWSAPTRYFENVIIMMNQGIEGDKSKKRNIN